MGTGINFGISKSENETIDDLLDKALANLQKFAGPIFKETLKHPSKTTTTTDPAAAIEAGARVRNEGIKLQADMMADVPSTGEAILGGLAGVASGIVSGGNMTVGKDNPDGSTAGKAIGAAVGGFLGSASFAGGRKAGKTGQDALGSIMGISGEFKKNSQQKMAEDAVGTATQELGKLNNPGNDPAIAAQNAAERERITGQLATDLVAAGVGPDKAISTASNIAAINAPNSKELQDPGMQAQRAIAKFQASGKTDKDKQELKTAINTIVLTQNIKLGKLPTNANALIAQITGESMGGGGGEGQVAGQPHGGGNAMTVEPVDEQGNVIGPAVAVGQGSGGAGATPPSGGSGIAPGTPGQLPAGVGEKGVSEDVRKMSMAATQVELKGQQAIDMLENNATLQSALNKKKGPVGSVLGTSEAEVYANGLGLPIPGIGKVGELGKHSSGLSALTPEEQAAVLKFNQLITPLAQAAGKMRDPGVLQGNEFKNAKDVTAALTLNPEQNIMMLKALLEEAASNKGLASSAMPKGGGNLAKKKKSDGITWLK